MRAAFPSSPRPARPPWIERRGLKGSVATRHVSLVLCREGGRGTIGRGGRNIRSLREQATTPVLLLGLHSRRITERPEKHHSTRPPVPKHDNLTCAPLLSPFSRPGILAPRRVSRLHRSLMGRSGCINLKWLKRLWRNEEPASQPQTRAFRFDDCSTMAAVWAQGGASPTVWRPGKAGGAGIGGSGSPAESPLGRMRWQPMAQIDAGGMLEAHGSGTRLATCRFQFHPTPEMSDR